MASNKRNAPDFYGNSKRKKRRKKSTSSDDGSKGSAGGFKSKRKLLKGEKVEVFSSDEGLTGSWHEAIIIKHAEKARIIEYSNLMNEHSSSKLVERLNVCEAIEGRPWTRPETYRGNIRPLPPPLPTKSSGLKYGLCVDALIDEVWWEGVIFDGNRCALERKVFFPDLGDQHMVSFDNIRVTQEWDEGSGNWTVRGEWVLLQVLEVFEQEDGLPVSIREIWYDLRSTHSFAEKIGVWTFRSPSVWFGMASELIREIRAVAYGTSVYQLTALNEEVYGPITCDSVDGLYEDLQSIEGSISHLTNTGAPMWSGDTVRGLQCSELHASDGWLLLGGAGDSISCGVADGGAGDSISCGVADVAYSHLDKEGNAVEVEGASQEPTNPKLKSCSHVLAEFLSEHYNRKVPCRVGTQQKVSAIREVVKSHLLAEGWAISRRDTGHRYYHSPQGKTLYSLVTACENWKQVQESGEWKNRCGGRCIKNGLNFSQGCWQSVDLAPEYCPEIVQLYACKFRDSGVQLNMLDQDLDGKTIRCNMKKHLLAVGWKIEEKPGKIQYVSPEGEVSYSLSQICSVLLTSQQGKFQRLTDGHGSSENHINSFQHEMLPLKCSSELERVGLISGMVDSSSMSESRIVVAASPRSCKDQQRTVKSNCRLPSGRELLPFEDLEPVNIPEAILAYKKLMDSQRHKDDQQCFKSGAKQKQLRSNAKKHLLFSGWKLWKRTTKNRTDMCYESPAGKFCKSVYSACKSYLKDWPSGKNLRSTGYTNRLRKLPFSGTKIQEVLEERHETEHSFSSRLAVNGKVNLYKHSLRGQKIPKRRIKPSVLSFPFKASHDKQLGGSWLAQAKKRKVSQASISCLSKTESTHPSSMVRSSKRSRENVSCSGVHVAKTVLSWLMDNNVVLPRQKVRYVRQGDGKVMMEGRLCRDGIKCNCCQDVFSLSSFEVHAQSSSRHPAENIVLPDGRSLLQCQMETMQTKKLNEAPHARMKVDYSFYESDYICSVCHDGGDLVLCDHCPSSFHLDCVGLEELPEGNWFCPSCQCDICGRSDYNSDAGQFTEETMLYCDQCEREYHVGCLRKHGQSTLRTFPTGDWFCSEKCSKIYNHLYDLLGKSNQTSREGLSWTLLRAKGPHDMKTMAEHHGKLQVALQILHECFMTVIESRTKSDFFSDLLFNRESELKRLNFWGFYTMVLEKDDEMISVATFRIFSSKVAEMPLIGTRVQFRRQGMCRLLVNQLEELLTMLGVERLLLPAVPQLLESWTKSFKFCRMTNSDRLELLNYSILHFQDTTMCQKILRTEKQASEEKTGKDYELSGTTCVEKMDLQIYCEPHEIKAVESISISSPLHKNQKMLDHDPSQKQLYYPSDGDDSSSSSDCIDTVGNVDEHNINGQTSENISNHCILAKTSHYAPEVIPMVDIIYSSEKKGNADDRGMDGDAQHFTKAISERSLGTIKHFYKRRITKV